ncbi:MAG: hypothetical protein S0880_10270 [Actinomycetota bacterium]|nr:hypothetical protein [Actinomycetota bacterium]
MAKASGLGDHLFVGPLQVSGDAGSVGRIGGGPQTTDVTGIDKSAYERLTVVRDGGIEFAPWFNSATDRMHDAVSALPTADVQVTYTHGLAVGNMAASCVAKQLNYDWTRAQDGSLSGSVTAEANAFGLEFGIQATDGVETFASADVGTTIDRGASLSSTSFGVQAYLHVLDIGSGTADIALQDSADGSTDWQDVVTFTAVTAAGTERVQSSRTENVRRYLRFEVTNTFTDLDVLCNLVVNDHAAPNF